eukprot:GEMP01055906.1.p1 GENE.GEMP01055906.1~~GEMP01055906.1.p1  ORF type:complete len:228 (+),score=36.03 GEMP01055906.1:75-758(+)
MVLLDFLRQAKAQLGIVKFISLGNTSGDLDSICSAIADAWISSTADRTFCPVLNFPRADFDLRIQQKSWLYEVIGAGEDDFLFYEDIDWHKVTEPYKLDINDVHLVDHHVLPSEQIHLSPKVSSVIDHHAPVGSWPEGVYTNIVVPLGSCASLFALRMPENTPLELWRLLWGPIIIDTVNFDESLRDQRWVQMDLDAAAAIPEEAKKENDYERLSDLKFDLGRLEQT